MTSELRFTCRFASATTLLLAALLLLAACETPAPPQVQAPREVHTAAYDLILPADQKALPLLRRSGYAQAQ
ncbi:MAG: hypothetical protein ACK46G_01605 [Flavobacteriales bacterium]|jgi:hypothetical protein